MPRKVPAAAAHDHRACLQQALAEAEHACAARGLRLTPLRRRVLELIWRGHSAVKAYDLLEQLQRERAGAAPPTVYRALEFLAQAGLIHRIESLNAFVGCAAPRQPHRGQFLICRRCENVAELATDRIGRMLGQAAARSGFKVERQVVEISGLCARCATQPAR
ncbi:MAG TPA: Fur family transcriptional regulator [Nevskiales bacterium]|nr:Fur family transcriptional regulator [Nevskiales bacterium]